MATLFLPSPHLSRSESAAGDRPGGRPATRRQRCLSRPFPSSAALRHLPLICSVPPLVLPTTCTGKKAKQRRHAGRSPDHAIASSPAAAGLPACAEWRRLACTATALACSSRRNLMYASPSSPVLPHSFCSASEIPASMPFSLWVICS